MASFEYTAENLAELERTLSADRLAPYRALVGGDRKQAIRLYEQNTLLSESLYGILQALEVALRNTIHAQLASGYGQPEWWDILPLEPEQTAMVRKAREALKREGKPSGDGRIVAELAFGFWTGLTSAKYETLWRGHLAKIVPRRPVQRVEFHDRLNTIRKLRNRVAHHEPILGRPLKKDANQIFDTLSWLSPLTARWVRSNSSFEERFEQYARTFPAVARVRP